MRPMKSSFSAALIRKVIRGLAVLSVPPLHSRTYPLTKQTRRGLIEGPVEGPIEEWLTNQSQWRSFLY